MPRVKKTHGLTNWRLLVLGYRRPIGLGCEDGAPDVTNVETYVLGNCVVFDDFDGFSDAAGVPVFDAGDQFGLAPVDLVVFSVGVFDNG